MLGVVKAVHGFCHSWPNNVDPQVVGTQVVTVEFPLEMAEKVQAAITTKNCGDIWDKSKVHAVIAVVHQVQRGCEPRDSWQESGALLVKTEIYGSYFPQAK